MEVTLVRNSKRTVDPRSPPEVFFDPLAAASGLCLLEHRHWSSRWRECWKRRPGPRCLPQKGRRCPRLERRVWRFESAAVTLADRGALADPELSPVPWVRASALPTEAGAAALRIGLSWRAWSTT